MFVEISQNLQENTCARVSFLNKVAGLRPLAQVFSCEFCEIFKNTFFIEHVRTTASKKRLQEVFPVNSEKFLEQICL